MFDRFIFGSMRLDKLGLENSVALVAYMLGQGVRNFHCSQEYASYGVFTESLKRACEAARVDPGDLQHMVKLASPHFGESEISPDAIDAKLQRYHSDLNCRSIDRVQWMLRADLKQEGLRHDIFQRDKALLVGLFDRLKTDGRINRLGCFPYTPGFGALAASAGCFDFMADYVNQDETNYKRYVPASGEVRLIAIRPFNAGGGFGKGRSAAQMLRFALQEPGVDAVVASPGSIGHFNELAQALRPCALA
jgi:hypothetical protein